MDLTLSRMVFCGRLAGLSSYEGWFSDDVTDGESLDSKPIPDVLPRHCNMPCRLILEDLVKASSDVLIMLCCCSAVPSHAEMAVKCTSGGGTTEIIGSCGVGEKTSGD